MLEDSSKWKSSGCEVGDEVTTCVCAMLAVLDVHHVPHGFGDLCRTELSWSVGFLKSELGSSVCLGLCNAPLNHQSLVNQTQGPAPEGFVGCKLNSAMTGECLGFSMASVQATFFFFFSIEEKKILKDLRRCENNNYSLQNSSSGTPDLHISLRDEALAD